MQHLCTAALAVAVVLYARPGWGEEAVGRCREPLGPVEAVQCALSSSTELASARAELDAIAGRRRTAGTWLPSHPLLALSAADRRPWSPTPGAPPVRELNWYVTLSQELEIAGQRWARLDEVDAEAAAQVRRVSALEREVMATALGALAEFQAAHQALALGREAANVGRVLERLAQAGAREASLSRVDADIASAEALRLALAPLEAERRVSLAEARLRALLGLSHGTPLRLKESTVASALSTTAPLSLSVATEQALTLRGEIAAAESERLASERRRTRVAREAFPNVTLSLFAQRDGFSERVLGGGLSIPLFLPGTIGPSRSGEIHEAGARLARADANREAIRRQVVQEVSSADVALRTRTVALGLVPTDLIDRARGHLRVLGEGLSSGQLSVREALLAQRSLIDLLQTHVDAQLAYALARIEFSRATGSPFLGGAR